MRFDLDHYKNLKPQSVDVQPGLTVLVGTNGSGKSSFLEYLFLNNTFENCVVYSSGVNESFSPKYRSYLKSIYRNSQKIVSSTSDDIEMPGGKYFFSKEWAPFLILASSFLSREGSHTALWMRHLGFKVASFGFEVNLPSAFRSKLKIALQNIEEGITDFRFETSQLVKFLNRLTSNELEENLNNTKFKVNWGSVEDLSENPRTVVNDILYRELFDSQLFTALDARINPVKKFFQMLQVLSVGGSGSRFIPLENSLITFNRGGQLLTIQDLSDGEFQILLNAALLDLFDESNSLFLLDEVDAHIHPTMVSKVWSSFDRVLGYAFTTSHNLLTISNTEYNRIIFLEDGTIISDTAKKVKLVEDICGTLFGAPVWKSLLYTVENLVLIDGLGDWDIFKELIVKAGIDFAPLEDSILVIEKSSGTDTNSRENLVKGKLLFVEEMLEMAKKSKIDPSQIKLRNIFMICDSDAYVCTTEGLDIKSGFQARGRVRFNVHSIIWNRRNIEGYLISPTARVHYDAADPADFIWGDLDNFGSLTENLLTQERKQRVDSKPIVRNFIGAEGFDKISMKEYVKRMSADDLDPYLILVFNEVLRLKTRV